METPYTKTYEFSAEHGSKASVTIKAEITGLHEADLEEILHTYAMYSHSFYLSLGKAMLEADQ